jgi:hypothetical protein
MYRIGMPGLLPCVIAAGAFVYCWIWSDAGMRTKAILTILYAASFGLLFLEGYGFLFLAAQCVLAIAIGWAAFGVDWLMKRH